MGDTQKKITKQKIIAFKIYFDRARMYLGYINFFILNLVLFQSFDNELLKSLMSEYKLIIIPLLVILYAGILLFIGFLDTKLGFRKEELRNNATTNPVIQDLVKTMNEIHKDLQQIKEKVK